MEDKKDEKSRWNERKADSTISDLKDDLDDIKERQQTLGLTHTDQAKGRWELQRRLSWLERGLDELEDDREYNVAQEATKGKGDKPREIRSKQRGQQALLDRDLAYGCKER
jgi:hypothetical protein